MISLKHQVFATLFLAAPLAFLGEVAEAEERGLVLGGRRRVVRRAPRVCVCDYPSFTI